MATAPDPDDAACAANDWDLGRTSGVTVWEHGHTTVIERIQNLLARIGRRNLLNFASYFVTKALSLGLFAFAVSWFVRRSGEHQYGIISLVLLLYTYLQMVDMGMGYAVVYRLGRAVARARGSHVRLVAETMPIYLACSIGIGVLLALLAEPLSRFLLGTGDYVTLFRLTALGVSCLIISALCVAVMQAYNRVYYVNFSRLVFDIIKAGALIVGAGIGADLSVVLWLVLAGAVLKLLIDVRLASVLLGTYAWLRPIPSRRALRLNIRVGAPMFSSSLIFSVINSMDKVLVAKVLSPATLATYSIATDLHAKAYFLLWAVTGSLYTPFIQRQARRESIGRLVWLAGAAVVVLLLAYYVPLAIFGREILALWINEEVAEKGSVMLRWLLVPTAIYMIANLMEVFLQTAGATQQIGWAYLVALFVQFGGLATLPGRFGVVGVIWSAGLMHFSLLVCFSLMILRRRHSTRFQALGMTRTLAKSGL
jgi:O-antigen/teichoic acid export membrane protein